MKLKSVSVHLKEQAHEPTAGIEDRSGYEREPSGMISRWQLG